MDWCGMILHPSCIPLKILLITIYFIILKKIKTCLHENTKLYFLPLFRKNINFTFKSSFWHLTLDKLVINSSDLNVYWFLNFTMRHRVLNQSSCGKIWRCLLEAPCSLVREFLFCSEFTSISAHENYKLFHRTFKCKKHEGALACLFWSCDHIQSSWKRSKKSALTSFCLLNRTQTNSSFPCGFNSLAVGKTHKSESFSKPGSFTVISTETMADLMRSITWPFCGLLLDTFTKWLSLTLFALFWDNLY